MEIDATEVHAVRERGEAVVVGVKTVALRVGAEILALEERLQAVRSQALDEHRALVEKREVPHRLHGKEALANEAVDERRPMRIVDELRKAAVVDLGLVVVDV